MPLKKTLNDMCIIGNFNKVTKRKPKNWIRNGYKIIVPYDFQFRQKVGNVECTCKVCLESYKPWYGVTWFHSEDCALVQYIKKRPQILNLTQYYDWDYRMIAQTE